MSAEPVSCLRTNTGDAIPLQGVRAQGRLEGLVFELTVEQRYRNTGPRNIEAVFTFPLPLHAVLLGVELEIGERRLSAVAVARKEATKRYEDALDQGDAAALVESQGNGLYTVSLGNLMPNESATVRYRYAELLRASGDWLRVAIPTVIAPRYGDPRDAGLDELTTPESDLLTEYPFELTLDVFGLPATAWLRSPSHAIDVNRTTEQARITLQRRGHLDRDFVLEVDGTTSGATALVAPDGEGWVVVANPTLQLPEDESRPLALKILLDCSGSMAGDSINAAKRALLELLEQLGEGDHLSLTCFGTRHEFVTDGLETMTAKARQRLIERVRTVEATLGGTEMGSGLRAVLQQPTSSGMHADVILITDGEIQAIDRIVALAARSDHRLFAIAIGAAPNEALARALADTTGGACEFVGPNDDAEAAILRTFRRLRSKPRDLADIIWPTMPTWTVIPNRTVFPNDTLPLYAGFSRRPEGTITLNIRDRQGVVERLTCALTEARSHRELLPRLAAARRLATLDKAAATELAVRHQLATEHTSFVVVAERTAGEKSTGLPTTIKVPHMLAAGWGATSVSDSRLDIVGGTASYDVDFDLGMDVKRQCEVTGDRTARLGRKADAPLATYFQAVGRRARLTSHHEDDAAPELESPDSGAGETESPSPFDPETAGMSLDMDLQSGTPIPTTYDALAMIIIEVDDDIIARLREIGAREAWSEPEIIAAFLLWIIEETLAGNDEEDYPLLARARIDILRQHRVLRGAITAVRRAIMNEDGLSPPVATS